MQAGNDANAFLIDTNQFQGTEDWAQIAQAKIHGILPVRGALIRASQGLSPDKAVAAAATGASHYGLYRGFYHTAIPRGTTYPELSATAKAQAALFVKTVQAVGGWSGRCLNPAVDIEVNPFSLSVNYYIYWLEQFLVAVEALLPHFPLKPMLYLSPSKWATLLGKTTTFQTYPLWVADWGVTQPADFGGWTQWFCWQWSAPGPLAGVPRATDYDEWHSATLPDLVVDTTGTSTPSASTPAPSWAALASSLHQLANDLDALAGRLP